MKKKLVSLVLAGVMAASVLAGCGSVQMGGGSSKTSATTAAAGEAGTQATAAASDGASSLKGQNVRVLIGSTSTSGDSYMMADLVTRYLSKYMGFNGKVDAVGNSTALETITSAAGDGKTVLMSHDITYMSVLFGAVDEKYALENMTIGSRIGRNPGGCFGAAKSSGWTSLSDVTKYLKDNPDKTVSFNIEAGGTSHICFVAYYLDVKAKEGDEVASRIKAIVGGTTAEKLQRLWDRNADVIYGDTSAFQQYTEDGVQDQLAMNMFDSGSKVEGVTINSMADDGIEFDGKAFDFPKDFAMYFPKDMDANVLKEYEEAMKKVDADPDFQADMKKLFYTPLSADDSALDASQKFIMDKRETCKEIISQAPNLDDITG
ncbi:MAG: tripartite tricarboxylate transporter substrate-binding protein [Oribacterium sp.]|nr:tripartite tricarboxylate transporter substrate-binding protein [Oribacterium sp.]MDY6306712.1 tripartite tricarboxylate transporter substrate-binding protein [Oribacterium sp.]MDY6317796.1 tripartite tricarboxylate transporter substrate-binding protein [Oribacterium sp.]